MLEKIRINDIWVDFEKEKLTQISISNKNFYYYNSIKIPSRCQIQFICDSCKNQTQFVNFDLKHINSFSFLCKKCKSIKSTMQKYGVENISQLQDIKDRKKQTLIKNFGSTNVFSFSKTKETMLKKYGAENISQSQEIQEKKKKNCLEKYGVTSSWQRDDVKEKIKETCLEKYGSEYASQSQEIKTKVKEKCLEKYGVENISQLQDIKEKKKQTCLKNNGVECGFLTEKSKNNNKQKSIDTYNVPYSFNGWKQKQTIQEKYDVENISQLDEIKKQKKTTMMKNYGTWKSFELASSKNTIQEKYGVENISQSDEIKDNKKQTCLKNWGVESPSQNPLILNKMMSSFGRKMSLKKINENLHYQSKPELEFINYCWSKNINIWDGPAIKYEFENKIHIYHVDFETCAYLIEIKGSHGWYKKDLESGKIEAKNKAAQEFAITINKEFIFLLDIDDYHKYIQENELWSLLK